MLHGSYSASPRSSLGTSPSRAPAFSIMARFSGRQRFMAPTTALRAILSSGVSELYATTNGYANAMLSFDSKGHQVFLPLAEPDGGAFFRQWEGKGSATMAVGSDGRPSLTLKDNKNVVFAKPENNEWATREMR